MEAVEAAVGAVMLAAQTILESGGETYRAEETAQRMGEAFGFVKTEILAFPTGFTIAFHLPDGSVQNRVLRIRERSIHLKGINEVNAISRKAAARECSPLRALEQLKALRSAPRMPPVLLILVFGLSAGFFCVMLGGRGRDFFLALTTGCLVQALMPFYRKWRAPTPMMSLFSGAVAAGMSLILIRFFGGNQQAVITGALMPLLPGLAMTNALRDTIHGDLVSGLARGADALLSALLLAGGVALVLGL